MRLTLTLAAIAAAIAPAGRAQFFGGATNAGSVQAVTALPARCVQNAVVWYYTE